MIETNPSTQAHAMPETMIGEAQDTQTTNFDAKITSKHLTTTWDLENPPYWSHARAEQRAQRRQERELNKILHNYQ